MHVYFHLSDTHFGSKGTEEVLPRLKELIEERIAELPPGTKVGFIVTGDGVNGPTAENGAQFLKFTDYLTSKSHREPLIVLGNHDVNSRGLAFRDGAQTLANYVGGYPRLKRVEGIKTIFILFNSNVDGIFAQGKIGRAQMEAAAALLDKIECAQDYTLVAVLHHHVAPVPMDVAPLPPWWRRIAPRWLAAFLFQVFSERTMRLTDAAAFVQFLKGQRVRLILHGHKHIPFITQQDGIDVVACGSSTRRKISKDPGRSCLSYNVLTFNEGTVKVEQHAEYEPGEGAEVIATATFDAS
ncbi:MAG: metallophosphoesterase [Actinomycetia bacterium]|nr:metallophosphoesterase [Actinomycetes bacterium]